MFCSVSFRSISCYIPLLFVPFMGWILGDPLSPAFSSHHYLHPHLLPLSSPSSLYQESLLLLSIKHHHLTTITFLPSLSLSFPLTPFAPAFPPSPRRRCHDRHTTVTYLPIIISPTFFSPLSSNPPRQLAGNISPPNSIIKNKFKLILSSFFLKSIIKCLLSSCCTEALTSVILSVLYSSLSCSPPFTNSSSLSFFSSKQGNELRLVYYNQLKG